MSRFVLDRRGVQDLANDPRVGRILEETFCEPAAAAAARIASYWQNQTGGSMIHESLGAYGTRSDGGDAFVVANTSFWHLIEFGTDHASGSHALVLGVEEALSTAPGGHMDAAAGREMVEYTTRDGRTRMATRAQVANWTRGSTG